MIQFAHRSRGQVAALVGFVTNRGVPQNSRPNRGVMVHAKTGSVVFTEGIPVARFSVNHESYFTPVEEFFRPLGKRFVGDKTYNDFVIRAYGRTRLRRRHLLFIDLKSLVLSGHDLPPKFHPAAIRASAGFAPFGAVS